MWELTFPQEWVARLASLLLDDAGIAHTCDERGNIARVVIPKVRDSGFDVTIEAATYGVIVRTGSLFHAHFPFFTYSAFDADPDSDPEVDSFDPYTSREPAEQAFGLVRYLLSPTVRIRERRVAGVLYHAALEVHQGDRWRRRRSVTLLRYPYWGKRDERLWTNTHLGPRLAE